MLLPDRSGISWTPTHVIDRSPETDSSYPSHMTRSSFPFILAVLTLLSVALFGAGCSTQPDVVLASDIPTVPDMEQRLGYDIKRRQGELVGGRFIFVGPILEMDEMIKSIDSRFTGYGWSTERSTWLFPRSELVFAKEDRRVRVILDADQLEPAMSRAVYQVSLAKREEGDSSATSD